MSTEENAPLTVTLKAGREFSDPWIVVRGDTPDDVTAKLNGLESVVQATIEAANFLKAANNAAPVLAGAVSMPPLSPIPPAQVPTAAPGWAQNPPQPTQAAAPQPPQQQYGNVTLHPEGKTCTACGQVLQYGLTRTNKAQWKCAGYRYNNGNPNEHTLEWV